MEDRSEALPSVSTMASRGSRLTAEKGLHVESTRTTGGHDAEGPRHNTADDVGLD